MKWLVLRASGGIAVANYTTTTIYAGESESAAVAAAEATTRANPEQHVYVLQVVRDYWTETRPVTTCEVP